MAGLYDIVCVMHDEDSNKYLALVLTDFDRGRGRPSRPYVRLQGEIIHGDKVSSLQAALDRLNELAKIHGIRSLRRMRRDSLDDPELAAREAPLHQSLPGASPAVERLEPFGFRRSRLIPIASPL